MRVGRAARVKSSPIGKIYSRMIRLFPNNSTEYASVSVALQFISMTSRKKLDSGKKYGKGWRVARVKYPVAHVYLISNH
jgi:hypothetical protein